MIAGGAGAVALLALVTVGAPGAPQAGARVTVEPDRATMSIGDRVTVRVVVEHDTAEAVRWPALPDTLGAFEVVAVPAPETAVSEGRARSEARIVLTAFVLGALEVPSIPVELVGPDGSVTAIGTEPLGVAVESVGRDEAGDIRDIKPPLDIPRSLWSLALWALGLLVAAGAAYWAYRAVGRRGAGDRAPAAPTAPPRPAHDLAYEALDRLDRSGMLDRAEIKAFHIAVSEIVRTYVHGRFGIDAMDMTSGDVLGALERAGVPRDDVGAFGAFLGRADLVKFAKHRPRPEACRDMIPAARHLVDRTRVREVQTAHPNAPAGAPSPVGGGGAASRGGGTT